MSKIPGNKQLFFIFRLKLDTKPFSKGPAPLPQIHSDIIYRSAYDPHQLILGIIDLEMQTPQNTALTGTLVILNKNAVNPCLLKIVIIISLHKITALVSV